jgi:hypothetical protein
MGSFSLREKAGMRGIKINFFLILISPHPTLSLLRGLCTA